MSEPLTRTLWRSIEDTLGAILAHPFLHELTAGTLPEQVFRFYVIQDALYLRSFARALSVLAGRAADPADTAMFASHAATALAVEQSLHAGFLRELGVSPEQLEAAAPAPTCRAYSSYLEASAHAAPFAEGVAAVLPCYWIYWEVGKHLHQDGSPNPRYRRWIDTYASEEFGAVVRAVLALMDRLGERADAASRASIHERFATAARYEWMFWDMAYHREQWPLPAPETRSHGASSGHVAEAEHIGEAVSMRLIADRPGTVDIDEFLGRPLFAHLATLAEEGPRESPVWFLWEDRCLWIIGSERDDSFPRRLRRDGRCAVGVIDFDQSRGIVHHVGIRGHAFVEAFDATRAQRLLMRYLGENRSSWDKRFVKTLDDRHNVLVRIVPETVVARDVSYQAASPETQFPDGPSVCT